ncbi:vesicle transport protein GOT1A-like [Onychomys torridus]|uniref:vesicle transport protein GOT1A-like n=1 Tax=Onychomys torridus TaxID=38674 RepID=UPI00167F824E|nr:vesicle transport protein GOT1A-like [Onychomys torridus]
MPPPPPPPPTTRSTGRAVLTKCEDKAAQEPSSSCPSSFPWPAFSYTESLHRTPDPWGREAELSLLLAEIGVGITGFGVFFIVLGILLYFDSVLLAFGNLLFLTGLSLIIGLRRTFSFFFQRHKLKGTSFFLGGVAIVLLRWPLLGMLLEAYGFVSLFKGFFPVAFGFLGSVSNIPFLSTLLQKLQGSSSMV